MHNRYSLSRYHLSRLTPEDLLAKQKQYHQLTTQDKTGAGLKDILDSITRRVKVGLQGPRTGPSSRFRTFLDSESGSQKIVGLAVARKPIESIVERALNSLSGGAFGETKKRLGYDNVYHSYVIATLENGEQFTIHKNETVQSRPTTKHDRSGELSSVNLPADHEFTIKSLVDTAATSDLGKPATEQSVKDFWMYDPSDRNCQSWSSDIIRDNDLSGGLDEKGRILLEKQDAKSLVDSLGPLRKIPKLVTDVAATADRVIFGDGLTGLRNMYTFEPIRSGKGFAPPKEYEYPVIRNKQIQ